MGLALMNLPIIDVEFGFGGEIVLATLLSTISLRS